MAGSELGSISGAGTRARTCPGTRSRSSDVVASDDVGTGARADADTGLWDWWWIYTGWYDGRGLLTVCHSIENSSLPTEVVNAAVLELYKILSYARRNNSLSILSLPCTVSCKT